MFFIHNQTYIVDFPGLNLRQCCDNPYHSGVKSVNAAVVCTGRTFLFYNDRFVTERDECRGGSLKNGFVDK